MGANNRSLVGEIKATKEDLSLSSGALNSLLTLADQLETKLKEVKTRENAVEIRENELRDKNQKMLERETKCTEKEQKVNERERGVVIKEEKWGETEKEMQRNADKLPDIIRLNVSGTKFAITKERLLKHKGSLFELMISASSLPLIKPGELFIERDPRYFRHVFNYLLTGTLRTIKAYKRSLVQQEFEFYKIPFTDTLLSNFKDIFSTWLKGKEFCLLYKASTDGFTAEEFHKRCDNKGCTLTLIRSSEGYIFGGYAAIGWDSSNNYRFGAGSFIFSLTNPHNIPPIKCNMRLNCRNSIYCGSKCGPSFGYCDMQLVSPTNGKFGIPNTYEDTGKGVKTFTGTDLFTVDEIEVYS